MELVPPDFVSEQEHEWQTYLRACPALKAHLTILLNAYRELVVRSMEGMDSADTLRSLEKYDYTLYRLDIPVLTTPDTWMQQYEQR